MAYLDFDTFYQRYPYTTVIASGAYGSVYIAGDYVVKDSYNPADPKVKPVPLPLKAKFLNAAVRELNFYQMVDHPCIAKVVAWSYLKGSDGRRSHVYLALPRGIPIKDALNQNLVTIDQVIVDLLSAVSFLNDHDIAHLDIKDANVIYYEPTGRVQLIDFGISAVATPTPQGSVVTGVAYTEPYRDPEYVETDYNPISVEMYAVGRTIYNLAMRNVKGIDFYWRDRTLYELITGNPTWDRIIAEAVRFPVVSRMPIRQLAEMAANSLGFSLTEGQLLETQVLVKNPASCDTTEVTTLLKETQTLAINYLKTARSSFLAVHLVHRYLSVEPPPTRGSAAGSLRSPRVAVLRRPIPTVLPSY